MLSFREYFLLEADETIKQKLKHLEHAEDLLIDGGIEGANRAVSFLERLVHAVMGGEDTSLLANIKIDGAPSIVAGPIPSGEPNAGQFFVGTKSALSPTGKRYTKGNRSQIHEENSPGLAQKLELCLQHLPDLQMKRIFQGDFLFGPTDKQVAEIGGNQYIVFKPNVITYAVRSDTPAGREVSTAKIGIVFHTVYEGDTFATMHATYNPDLSSLRHTPDVWWKSNRIQNVQRTIKYSPEDIQEVQQLLARTKDSIGKLDRSFISTLQADANLRSMIKMHINSKVRQGQFIDNLDDHIRDLRAYIKGKLQQQKEKMKSEAGQKKVELVEQKYAKFLSEMPSQVIALFNLYNQIAQVKIHLLRRLGSLEDVESFITDKDVMKPTSGEGLVLADAKTHDTVKLVDRLEFSRINFMQPKEWK